MIKIEIGRFLYFTLALILINCAGQYPPPGGPIDTTPPKILYSIPEPNELFFKGNKIILKFDKYVDPRSVQEAIFISPDPGALEYEWSGKELEIFFNEKLKENTTYILTIGTDAKDRRGNNLAETFALPFSTGQNIDSCYLTGKVFAEKPEAVKIFAYKITDTLINNFDPTLYKPDYLSQTSKDGTFILKYLATGKYRLIAIKDVYNNLLYDIQVDQFGTAQYDLQFDDTTSFYQNINFRLTIEDTSKPFITSIQVLNKNQIKIVLNEPVRDTASFNIVDYINQNNLPVKSYFLIKPNTFLLYTDDQDSIKYKLIYSGIIDTAGNEVSMVENFIEFAGSFLQDTAAPDFEFVNIKQNETDVVLDKSFIISFSEEINKKSFENGFKLIDATNDQVVGEFIWDSDVRVKFLPSAFLQSKMKYSISIKLDSLMDINSNSIKDSTFILTFTTIEKNKLSSISGSIVSDKLSVDYKSLIVEIYNIDKKRTRMKMIKPDELGKFVFNDIPEGKYIIEAFEDRNRNMKYDCGRVKPFEYSEFFSVYPDTINLRARWPIENVKIKF